MKKLFALILVLAMLLSIVGCVASKPAEEPVAAPAEAAATEAPAAAATEAPAAEEPAVEDYSGINLIYGLAADWNVLSNYAGSATASVIVIADKIFDKLFYITEAGEFQPRNAESWKLSDDKSTLTLTLNKNAKWHDGEAVTAYDWEYTFRLLAAPASGYTKPSNMKYFAGTDDGGFTVNPEDLGINAVDDYTLEMHFKEPVEDLNNVLILTNVVQTHVLPKHLLGDIAIDQVFANEYFNAPIGSGPCIFVSQVMNSEVVVKANEEYYLGRPGFETLTFKRIDAPTSLATFASNGDLDMMYPRYNGDQAMEAMDSAKSGAYTAVLSDTPAKALYLMFNNMNISDSRIRQAVQYCIDRDALVAALMGEYAIPTTTYVTYENPNKNTDIDYAANLEKAAALLAECGYSTEKPLKLTMDTVSGYRATVAAYIQQEVAKVGIELEIRTTDTPTAFAELQSGTVDLAWILDSTYAIDLGGDYYYHANNSNFTMVQDTTFDDMMKEIERIQGTGDKEALKKAMYDWQQFIYDQAVIIPLFFQYSVAGCSNRMGNAKLFDINYWNDNVWEWKIAK